MERQLMQNKKENNEIIAIYRKLNLFETLVLELKVQWSVGTVAT